MNSTWVMSGFLKLTAYQLNVIEQKYEEHTVMTGLLLWLKGKYIFSGRFTHCWFHPRDSK